MTTTTNSFTHRHRTALALATCLGLAVAACGSSDDSQDTTAADSTGAAAAPESGAQRALDFSPFGDAIESLGSDRLAQLDEIVTTTDIDALRDMLAAGDVTSRELTLAYVSRIETYDSALRSVIELNPEALAEADRVDEARAAGDDVDGMHGLPVLLKDNIATGDRMHNTAGAAALADHVAPRDSFVAEQLREDGAILLGKTNLSEWAYFMSTTAPSGYSALGGQVVNPYGADLEVFGSSTGSAVAASAFFAAATVGTETTGSIVAPAAANGVVGMRPTLGLVSGDLIIPISTALDSAGPMGRTVDDVAALLTSMAIEDPDDIHADLAAGLHGTDFESGLDDVSLDGITIGVPDFTVPGDDDPTLPVFEATVESLEAAGASVVIVPISVENYNSLAGQQLELFNASMRRDVNAYLAAADAPIESLADVIAYNDDDLDALAPFGQDLLVGAEDNTATEETFVTMMTETRSLARDTIATGASAEDADVLMSLDNTFSLLYAMAGNPAVTVPAGVDAAGQPHGATFVGIAPGTDADVLGVANAFETETGLRVAPTLSDS